MTVVVKVLEVAPINVDVVVVIVEVVKDLVFVIASVFFDATFGISFYSVIRYLYIDLYIYLFGIYIFSLEKTKNNVRSFRSSWSRCSDVFWVSLPQH